MDKPRKLFTRKYFNDEIIADENFPDYGTYTASGFYIVEHQYLFQKWCFVMFGQQ